MVKQLLDQKYYALSLLNKDKSPWTNFSSFKKTSAADLTLQDKNGNCVFHYAVLPNIGNSKDEHFSYAMSDSLIRLLAQVTGKNVVTVLNQENNRRKTPLNLALENGLEKIAATLQELSYIEKRKYQTVQTQKSQRDVQEIANFDWPKADFREDSKKFCEKIRVQEEAKSAGKIVKREPDPVLGFAPYGEIVLDEEQEDFPFDVLLTMVDIGYGIYGLYNYYKLQLAKHTERNLIVILSRWGRVGDEGQHQITPFPNLEEAKKEYKKIFKAKSGNAWEDVKSNFNPLPKKYRLVGIDEKKMKKPSEYKLNLTQHIKPALNQSILNEPSVYRLIKKLIVLHDGRNSFSRTNQLDVITAARLLSNDSYHEAEKILKEIKALIEKKEKIMQKTDYQKDDLTRIMDEIVALSETFYFTVPVEGYSYEKLKPMFTIEELTQKQQLIHSMLHSGLALQLLLAAQLRVDSINPVDYVYRALNRKIRALKEESKEAQMILQYAANTSTRQDYRITAIYKLYREEEESTAKIGNRMLLWHGTKSQNLLSILADGLQVAPLDAQISGHMYGKVK